MNVTFLFVLLALLLIITAVVSIVAATKAGQNVLMDARRRIRVLYGVATLLGLGFALLAFAVFPVTTAVPGLLIALAPSLAGIVFVIAATVGESFWPVPKGQQRGAFLARRPMFANAAPAPLWASATWAVLLVAALVLCGFAATSDGRSIAHPIWNPNITGASGPFPGWPYGVPMLISSAVLVAVTLYALRVIARRPAVTGIDPDLDAQLRRTSATNLMKGVQLSFAVSLGGVLMVAGTAGSNAGIVDVDGYFATLAGHWWAYPAMTLAVVTIIVATIVAVWKQK